MPSAARPAPAASLSSSSSSSWLPNLVPAFLSSDSRQSRNSKRRRSTSLSSTSTTSASSIATDTLVAPTPASPSSPRSGSLATTPVPHGALLLSGTAAQDDSKMPATYVDRRAPRQLGIAQRWWIWYSGSYVSSMLEPWELILIHTVLLLVVVFLYFALAQLPPHLRIVAQRTRYYISGVGDWARS
ncbi:hypothetical protein JCM10207_000842 [Rhodosporidiobolus poonsookiae]